MVVPPPPRKIQPAGALSECRGAAAIAPTSATTSGSAAGCQPLGAEHSAQCQAPVPLCAPAPVPAPLTGQAPSAGVRLVPPPPQRLSGEAVAAVMAQKPKRTIDYSKFDQIEDSDEEAQGASASGGPSAGMGANRPTMRIIQMPTEAVTLDDYRAAFKALLDMATPQTMVPDVEGMFKMFKSCPDTTDRALLDQACHAVEGVPFSAMRHGFDGWKTGTAQMTQAMLARQRFDEARLWCVIRSLRMPEDVEPLHVHAWCLEEQWTHVLHTGEAKVRRFTWQGAELVGAREHAETLQVVLRAHLQRSIELSKGDHHTASYAGLSASFERSGHIAQARKVGRDGARRGIWTDEWQRPAHFVRSLHPRQPWHDPATIELCAALEQALPDIREEFERYMSEVPKLKDVGIRSGEAMLVETGTWREIPLFNAGRMDHEVCSKFPETVRVLTERCADATGLAFCGGGEVAFRLLSPGTKLKPHCGPTNARLTCLLGISVPLGAEPGIAIAGAEPRPWIDGKCIAFDDSFEHFEELDEMADGDCVVFTAHFWHPAFQHKNDPEWKVKGIQETPQGSNPPANSNLFMPMGGSSFDATVENELPPID